MTKDNVKDMRAKILNGIDLAYRRLLITKQKNNEDIVISKDGKIVHVKASELLK